MYDFLWRALIAGFGVAAIAGPLGSFVVWRRMAYFGDTLAHSALLGVALGVLSGVGAEIGVLVVGTIIATLLVMLKSDGRLTSNTMLGILAHGGLALGIVSISFIKGPGVNLMAFLTGDILAVTTKDIAMIYGGGILVAIVLAIIWRPLLSATVNEELARVEGVAVKLVNLVFMVLLALTVGLAIKVVGILLVTALLIIPAAAARNVSGSPESMALMAGITGCIAVGIGLFAALAIDAPGGPMIVVAALALFLLSTLIQVVRQN